MKQFSLVLLVLCILVASNAMGHHGWGWSSDEEFQLSGKIIHIEWGHPHSIMTLESNGEIWAVEIGQPWLKAEARVPNSALSLGTIITVIGQRSSDTKRRFMKATHFIIDGTTYDLKEVTRFRD